jgi:hypothetical protein
VYRQPPSGLAAMKSQKLGRRYLGSVRSSTSEFIVTNVATGLCAKPSENAWTIPRLKA